MILPTLRFASPLAEHFDLSNRSLPLGVEVCEVRLVCLLKQFPDRNFAFEDARRIVARSLVNGNFITEREECYDFFATAWNSVGGRMAA